MIEPVAGLDYVTLDVTDLERATAFWWALLGLEVVNRLPATPEPISRPG